MRSEVRSMNHKTLKDTLFTFMNGLFYGSLISFAALATLITAFSFNLPPASNKFFLPLDLTTILWCCIGFSAIFSLCFSIKHLWFLVPILVIGILGYGWHLTILKEDLFDFLYIVSKRYDNAYGCGVILLNEEQPLYEDLTTLFRSFALIGTALVTWATCKRQSSYWVLLFSLLCFIPCCVIINTVPTPWSLFLLFLSLVLYLLTNHSRKNNSQHSILLTISFAGPVVMAMVLLFSLISPDTYRGMDRAEALLNHFENPLGLSNMGHGGTRTSNSVDLNTLGRRQEWTIPVMYITAPTTDTYYLRGESYSIYTGLQWKADAAAPELPWSLGVKTEDTVYIRTRFDHEVLYLPYSAHSSILFDGGNKLENTEGLNEYQYEFFDKTYPGLPYFPIAMDVSYWTSLPEETTKWASPLVFDLYVDHLISEGKPFTDMLSDNSIFIEAISNYVRSCAVYDLGPDPMDESYTDFAQWFIEKGESGYCVHFASTAVILLRAAGIPARYVSGYKAEAIAGQETTVYQKDAHAWVEYWDYAHGWQILEVTPARQLPEATESSETETTTQTEETTETTENTTSATTAPTAPEETSEVTKPTENSGLKPHGNEPSKIMYDLWNIVKWLLIPIGFCLLLLAQRKLRLYLWQKAYMTGTGKEKALKAWNKALSYSKLLKEPPDAKLRSIAEKAKFSQHIIAPTELDQFHSYFQASQEKLKSKPFHHRIYARWILVLY